MSIALLDTNVLLALARPSHQQVNDAWLVRVARKNSGRLVTLDTRLPVHALEEGQVEVITT